MLKIDIISGFLGSGKTTFIKRLLQTKIKNEKIVIIENEFGEISVDSMFLDEAGVQITELSQGCICCSLVGDFAKSLDEVIDKFNPDRIIIEPSGVGKLSDVIKAIENAGLKEYLNTYICIVDASKAKVYSKNFKEFFADQIANAKTVILSRTDIAKAEKIEEAFDVVRNINSQCNIVTTPVFTLDDEQLLLVYENQNTSLLEEVLAEENHHICKCGHHHEHHHEHHHHEECCCGEDHHHEHHHHEECCCGEHHHHEHHHHEECCCGEHHHHEHHHEECCCGEHHHHEHHHHHADEVFNSVSVEAYKVYCFEQLKEVLNELAYTNNHGFIIRAKGIVNTTNGWIKFNITPEELLIEENKALTIGSICVIGVNLDSDVIKNLF